MKTLGLRVAIQQSRLGGLQPNSLREDGTRKAWAKSNDAPDTNRLRGRAGMERRTRWLQRQPLCVHCEQENRVTLGAIVDHVIPLFQGGRDDESNLQTLCVPHHDAKSITERGGSSKPKIGLDGWPERSLSREYEDRRFPLNLSRSRVPLIMLCGPPGSGKSTYLRTHVGPKDVVIDLDQISQQLSGLPEHHTGPQWVGPALDERNRQLRALAQDTTHDRAWFIIAAPDPIERQRWADTLGAEVVLLDTPLDECIRRIKADATRTGHTERMVSAARAWWAMNATQGSALQRAMHTLGRVGG